MPLGATTGGPLEGTTGDPLPVTVGDNGQVRFAGDSSEATAGSPLPATTGGPLPATVGEPDPGSEPARIEDEYAITLINDSRTVIRDVISVSVSRQNSGVGSMTLIVGYQDEELAEHRFSDVTITYDERTLFRGELREVDPDPRGATTTLTVYGPAYQLEAGDLEVTYTNIYYDDAIADFWSEYTPFTATVTEPPGGLVAEEDLTLQEAPSDDAFGDLYTVADTDPVEIVGGEIDLLQTAWTDIGGVPNASYQGTVYVAPAYSGTSPDDGSGEAVGIEQNGDYVEWTFSVDHTIPEGEVGAWIRDEAPRDTRPEVEFSVDGQVVNTLAGSESFGGISLSWTDITDAVYGNDETNVGPLDPGEHTIRAEVTSESSNQDPFIVDRSTFVDMRYDYTFDNDVTTDDNGDNQLDGPELYPHQHPVEFNIAETERSITHAYIDVSMGNTSANQAIGVTFDGDSWLDEPNTNRADWDADAPTRSVQGRVKLSRYPLDDAQNDTPRFGYKGQALSSWELSVDTSSRTAIDDQTFEGTPLEILDELHNRGGLNWYVDPGKSDRAYSFPQSRSVRTPNIQPIEDGHNPTWDTTDYYNSVVVYGKRKDDGTRYSGTARDQAEIDEKGEVGPWPEYTDLESDQDCEAYAESLLDDFVQNDERSGSIEMVPRRIDPGTSLVIDEWDDDRRVGPYSIYLDGESSIRLPTKALEGHESGAILMWVKAPFRTAGHKPALIGSVYHSSEGHFESKVSRSLELRIGGTDGFASVQAYPGSNPPRDEWTLIHYDWDYDPDDDRTTVRAGHDGEILSERGFSGQFDNPDDLLRIGQKGDAYYEGYVDDVRVYEQALTESQYGRLTDRRGIPSTDLTSRYPMNEGPDRAEAGAPVYDVVGGYHASRDGNAEYRGSPFTVESVEYSESDGEFTMSVDVGESESFADELASRSRDVRELRKRD